MVDRFDRVILGIVLGLLGAIWVLTYIWVDSFHAQALMIFISIVSAVNAISHRRSDRENSFDA